MTKNILSRFIASGLLGIAAIIPSTSFAHITTTPQQFGALADGAHDDTPAIQQAIDYSHQQGGGVVNLTTGLYLSGPLQLKDHVTLHLDKGAILKADNRRHQFQPAIINRPAHAGEAFILANHVSDVAITGEGKIDGNGAALWWPDAWASKKQIKRGDTGFFTQRYPDVPLANGWPRPWLIEFNQVTDGRIGAITATNSPMWNIVLRHSSNITLDGTTIQNPPDSPNTDGVDIVSSQHIHMSRLTISTGDDNIAIKSGLPGSVLDKQASSDITLTHSTMLLGHGVSIGSETANGIHDVEINQVRFDHTENGIRIKSGRDRGADISQISAHDLTMHAVQTPITITDYYTGQSGDALSGPSLPAVAPRPVTASTPFIHDVSLKNIQAEQATTAAIIYGLPEAPFTEITLENVRIQASRNGILMAYSHKAHLHQVNIQSPQQTGGIKLGPDATISTDSGAMPGQQW